MQLVLSAAFTCCFGSLYTCSNPKLVLACRGENLDGKAAAQAAVEEARQAGGRISAFYCESVLSCGGQVVLPAGYLQDVYHVMHEAGALCIADEVPPPQAFLREGSHHDAIVADI